MVVLYRLSLSQQLFDDPIADQPQIVAQHNSEWVSEAAMVLRVAVELHSEVNGVCSHETSCTAGPG